jgi:hypothetical protein
MSLKVYKSETGVKYNILLKKSDGRQALVSFKGGDRSFRTNDEELQRLIEASKYFEKKFISISEEIKDGGREATNPAPSIYYTDVVDIQGAIDVLIKDFHVKESKLKTPDQVKKAAAENNVDFPNLSWL